MAKYQAYAEYQDSGVEWLGQVPTHWDIKRIKETAQIINGYPFDSGKFDPVNGTPLVRIRDINSNETQIFFNGFVPKEALIFNSDILIGMDGDFNVCEWKGGDAALNQRVCCLRSNDKYLTKFLAYLLPARMKIINDLTYFTTVKHLSSTDVLKTVYAIPNKIEYVNIVKFLDHETSKIDHLIKKQQQLIELLKEKRQAVISHAVTKGLDPNVPMKDSGVEWLGEVPEHWTVMKFNRCVQIRNGLVDPRHNNYKNFILYAPNHIEKATGKILYKETAEEQGADSNKYLCFKGEVVYSKIRPALAKVAVCEEEIALCSADMYPMNACNGLTNGFLYYFILSDSFTKAVILDSDRVAMPKINRESLNEYRLPIPPIDEQVKILKHIEISSRKLDELEQKAVQAIQLMQERRTALISSAVTGKIDLRNWQAPTLAVAQTELSA